MNRVLITGGSGFVGRAVVALAIEQGYTVINVDRMTGPPNPKVNFVEVTESSVAFWRNTFEATRPDAVIHLAGEKGVADTGRLFHGNIILTHEICEALSALNKGIKLVLADSAASIGVPASLPALEDQVCIPLNAYGVSKLAQSMLARSFETLFGIPLIVGRIFNITGPGEPKGLVCRDMAGKFLVSDSSVSLRAPHATRDFLDVRDVASALLVLAKHGVAGNTYNICSNSETSLLELSAMVVKILKSSIPIQWETDDAGTGVKRIYGANDKLKALGWQPAFSLEESLTAMITYVQLNQ